MVAKRPISKGELIALERPLIVSRTDVTIAEDQSTTGVFYRAALSLSSAHSSQTVKWLWSPMLLKLSIPDCSPNANFFFNPISFTGQFHAIRRIAKDEEITVLYCELAASREEQRAELLVHYKFL
ncbi:hypothetical protein DFH07DRAFT_966297 [Mycena maculata]|uniref:SET domain-containing protein n=1 Tax=Mycena maculata TaxID=230809 RepID=A0AAD7I966_9AGAR|nr:hypothetical protein DFH07DRAFT_966297 [Mycena maculata]